MEAVNYKGRFDIYLGSKKELEARGIRIISQERLRTRERREDIVAGISASDIRKWETQISTS